MAYLRLGTGPPLVFLPGLSSHHRPPNGVDRWFQLQQIKPLTRGHEVWWDPAPGGTPSRRHHVRKSPIAAALPGRTEHDRRTSANAGSGMRA